MTQRGITKETGLPKFEGLDVLESEIKITGAGDGLSKALEIEPVAHHFGEHHYYVVRTVTQQVNHRPLTPTGSAMKRVHTEPVVQITEVDPEAVKAFLDEAQQEIDAAEQRRRDEEVGQTGIPFDPPDGKTWNEMKVEDIMSAVGSDTDRAAAALADELNADKPRQGLIRRLEAIVDGDADGAR